MQNDVTVHSLGTKIVFNENESIVLQFQNFKFHLRWDLDEPILCTLYSFMNNDEKAPLPLLSKMKQMKVDLLKCVAEDSDIYYYDPSTLWRINCDLHKILDSLEKYGDRYLQENEL